MRTQSTIVLDSKMDHISSTPIMATRPELCEMTPEVYDIMCGLLPDTRSLKNLRLTCRALYKKTETVFVQRVFKEIHTSLTEDSLTGLEEIAKSEKYCHAVDFIIICPVWPEFRTPDSAMSDDELTALFDKEENFRQRKADVSLLANCFRLLRNLKTAHVGRKLHTSEVMTGGGNRVKATSRGLEPLLEGGNKYRVKASSHGFQVLMEALAIAGKQLEQIRAGLPPSDNGSRFDTPPYENATRNSIDDMSLQSVTEYYSQRTSCDLGLLKELSLVLEIRANTHGPDCATDVKNFLKIAYNVKSLSLSFPQTSCNWLAALPEVTLPHLTSLSIKAAHRVCASELWDFTSRHRTLKILKLCLVDFTEKDPFQGLLECLQGLKLNEIDFRQLTSRRAGGGLMLFGFDNSLICDDCVDDVRAAWAFQNTAGCKHATLSAKCEHDVYMALHERLATHCILPHPGFRRFEE